MEDKEIIEKIKKLMIESPLGYFSRVFSNKNPELREFVQKHSVFLDGKVDSVYNKPYAKSTRIIYAINGLTDFVKCKTCGKPITRNIASYENIDCIYCSNRCAQKDPDVIARVKATKMKNHGDPNFNNIDKNKQTCKKRYGVEYAWQSNRVKEASKRTLIEHFGVDHQMRSKEVTDGMRRRYKEKHGVECTFQDPVILAKIHAKNQANYGVDYPMQNKEMHKIMHDNSARTQKINYYNNVVSKQENVEAMFGVEEWIEHASHRDHEFLWKCRKCGKVFKHKVMYGSPLFARCYDCDPILVSTSNIEKEITVFLNSLGNGIVALNKEQDNRSVISPQEIDIIVKKNGSKVLMIEVDGLYWHSVLAGKDKFYHIDKTNKCESQGYQLVHIFEDEWKNKQEIVKSRLKNMIGIYDRIVFARKCEVKELSSKECKEFFDATHIQGNCQSSIRYGLYLKDELVAAMSFGFRRKMMGGKRVEGEYELLRFSTKLGYHVIGGAGKLLASFERNYKPTFLISYADRRWSKGNLYKALGFTLDHISAPNYWYLRRKNEGRIYRYAFRKSVLPKVLDKFDPSKTEIQNMLDNGFNYIWDCGNYVFIKRYALEDCGKLICKRG